MNEGHIALLDIDIDSQLAVVGDGEDRLIAGFVGR
jgi:hypothetical protein